MLTYIPAFTGAGSFLVAAGFVSCEKKYLAVMFLCLALTMNGFTIAEFPVNHIDVAPKKSSSLEMVSEITIALSVSCLLISVSGHGRMIDPPQRSSLWRVFKGQGFEPNYNDNELFCGGFARQYFQNDGKCGTCGDPYDGERKNEAGGIYATGFIARRYQKGQDIEVEIQLTANHFGSFVFKICPNNDITTQVSHECLDQNVLELAGQPDETRYKPNSVIGSQYVKLALPADMTYKQCVLQWHYTAGNNHNGPQETFITFADIAIDDDANSINPTPVTSKSPTTKASTQPPPTTTTKSTTQKSLTTTKKPTTTKSTTTSTPSTNKPTTKASSTTTSSTGHVTSCKADEVIDFIGVGVYAGLGYERWCNTYYGDQHAACSPNLCQCRCIQMVTC
ncbi:unnamed protein product [Mytilus coruscus]|uniref:Chitin-binding type-4 domain-containing protein n=1 Tax=Mytilus coruscus TaxID=42192 RepID=A0A6J8BZ43_MYTCO|nr:unnamed protein product [Mytilus coruscus]